MAAGGSPFDIGSDTGGSIRVPSGFCGTAGIKPTSGRVPRTGHIIGFDVGYAEPLTQLGPIARNVEDLFPLLKTIAGSDEYDPAVVDMPLCRPEDRGRFSPSHCIPYRQRCHGGCGRCQESRRDGGIDDEERRQYGRTRLSKAAWKTHGYLCERISLRTAGNT